LPAHVDLLQEAVKKNQSQQGDNQRGQSEYFDGIAEQFREAGAPPYLEDKAHGRPGSKFHLTRVMENFGGLDIGPVIINGVIFIREKENAQQGVNDDERYNGYV
jgi:hypothetical protein